MFLLRWQNQVQCSRLYNLNPGLWPSAAGWLGQGGKSCCLPLRLSVEKILCKLVAGSDLMAGGNRKLVNPDSQALP